MMPFKTYKSAFLQIFLIKYFAESSNLIRIKGESPPPPRLIQKRTVSMDIFSFMVGKPILVVFLITELTEAISKDVIDHYFLKPFLKVSEFSDRTAYFNLFYCTTHRVLHQLVDMWSCTYTQGQLKKGFVHNRMNTEITMTNFGQNPVQATKTNKQFPQLKLWDVQRRR